MDASGVSPGCSSAAARGANVKSTMGFSAAQCRCHVRSHRGKYSPKRVLRTSVWVRARVRLVVLAHALEDTGGEKGGCLMRLISGGVTAAVAASLSDSSGFEVETQTPWVSANVPGETRVGEGGVCGGEMYETQAQEALTKSLHSSELIRSQTRKSPRNTRGGHSHMQRFSFSPPRRSVQDLNEKSAVQQSPCPSRADKQEFEAGRPPEPFISRAKCSYSAEG
ncbi:unnamed protein product [Pleuronectes platessa]|uniref:Uncharacterized protein n=1 Tax=Pleuronectes platessa TaxID=8262 RepID=A0A9N7US34_PLEPL|nr:unnamed protein product [Pleuronectes platessa]